ncbi:MAG TPA: DUF2894 domain-containing protein [Polyangiales bacterium]|nr:DUF2894 domain-containing protein [Polyangiales bacterium]
MELADVERVLDALEARGARAFDSASCDCVRALITRGEALEDKARALLARRAQVHAERLTERFDKARIDTSRLLDSAERTHGAQSKLRAAFERGDLGTVRRALRKLGGLPPPATPLRKPDAHEYEDSLAEMVASFALARAVDVVPQDAGPYNPLRIASDLLERMRKVSPIYLTAQLNRLEELASMMALPELPEPASKTLPRKRRGRLKSGSS